eukprot:9200876-Pyramimonas_sp.AAC.1
MTSFYGSSCVDNSKGALKYQHPRDPSRSIRSVLYYVFVSANLGGKGLKVTQSDASPSRLAACGSGRPLLLSVRRVGVQPPRCPPVVKGRHAENGVSFLSLPVESDIYLYLSCGCLFKAWQKPSECTSNCTGGATLRKTSSRMWLKNIRNRRSVTLGHSRGSNAPPNRTSPDASGTFRSAYVSSLSQARPFD